jgi:SNF2 family DNA or RNA helicase
MDKIFNEKMIKRLSAAITYERGVKLYNDGAVKSYSAERDSSSNLREVKSLVSEELGSKNENKVYLLLNYNRENIEEFTCGCQDYNSGKRSKPCKHIVAAYLRHIKGEAEASQIAFDLDSIKTEKSIIPDIVFRLEPKVKDSIPSVKMLLKLNLIIAFDIDKSGSETAVELMIGENEIYSVSDVREFLNSVKHKNYTVSCENGFAFKPNEHYFNEKDGVFLKILSSAPIINSSHLDSRKRLIINAEILDLLIQLLYGRGFSLKLNGQLYKNVRLINGDIPLSFELVKYGDYNWILKQVNELPIDLTGKGKYYFHNNGIYIPTIQQAGAYSIYHKSLLMSDKKEVYIKDSNRKVKDEIIPLLKSISNSVEVMDKSKEINDTMKTLISKANFKTYINLDKTLSGISLGLKFIYGNVELDMFSESKYENASKVENRQSKLEMAIIEQIKSMGFEATRRSFVLEDEDKLLDFLSEGVIKLEIFGELSYSEAARNFKVYDISNYKVRAAIREDGLLEFGFSIDGVSNSEFVKIFNSLKSGEKYYKLLNGGLVSLNDKVLNSIKNLVEYLDAAGSIENGGTLVASKYNALYVEQYLKDNELLYIEKNRRYRELVNNINNIKEIDFTLPEHLEKVMRPYQKVGYKWLKTLAAYGFGGVLADEMGLGKTLQAIAFIASEAAKHEKPVLVVVPTSLVYNWEQEVRKFAPELKTLVLYGKKRDRITLLEDIESYNIVVTSYAVIRNDISYFDNIEFSYCFIDEAQQIKNSYTNNARAVKQIKAKAYFALTGTPMENSLVELWSVFDFIMPGYLLSKNRFNKVYADSIILDRDKNAMEALKRHTTPFMLRRLKAEVMKELPPKIEHKLVVEMTEEQKSIYMGYVFSSRNAMTKEFNTRGFSSSKINVLSALTRLRQICCEPSVVFEDYEGESGKMLALSQLLNEALNDNHRILLFSQFTSVLEKIAFMLKQKDIDYFYLDGKTKSEDRLRMSTEFNEGSREVFLVSLKAGGFGLNLTGADIVIHFDPWWNPAVEEQATDRAHRIGQNKTVQVIKLITQGTIEEKILKLQEKKKEIIDSVIESNNAESIMVSSLTEEDFEELFSYEV